MDINKVKNSVEYLRNYANEHNLKLVFRNTTTNQGDFCFFIYNCNNKGKGYLTGFDGYWDAEDNDPCSFNNCWNGVHQFITNYKVK